MRRLSLTSILVACAPATATTEDPQQPTGLAGVPFTYPDIPAGAEAERPVPISAPDPDKNQIAQTETAMFHKGAHVNRTYFCVHPSGVTEAITTVLPTRDPKLDAIVRDMIAAWTFKPASFQGQPTRACGRVEMKFRFR